MQKAGALFLSVLIALSANGEDAANAKAQLKAFEAWLRANGAVFKGDVARFGEFGRGMRVLEDLQPGDVILDIPESLWMTEASANRTAYGPVLKQLRDGKHIDETQAVALLLLTEKYNSSSFWKPWLDVLPLEFETPLYYPAEDLQELVGTSALDIRDKQVKQIEALQKVVEMVGEQNPDVFPKDLFTQATLAWSLSTVWARSAVGPDFNTVALIPLVDMLNHRDDGLLANFTAKSDAVVLLAANNVNLGEQVFLNYGTRTSSQLLATYGFLPADRKDDFLLLSYSREPQTPLDLARAYILQQRNCFDGSSNSRLVAARPLAPELLYCLRIALMDANDYDKAVSSWSVEKPFGLDNELKVLRALRGILSGMQDKFSSSAEADAELLRDPKLTATRRNALTLRMSERSVVKHGLEVVDQRWVRFLTAEEGSGQS